VLYACNINILDILSKDLVTILFMLLWRNTFYCTGRNIRFRVATSLNWLQCASQSTQLTFPQYAGTSRVADNTVVGFVASYSTYKIYFYTKHTTHADSFNLLYFQDVEFHGIHHASTNQSLEMSFRLGFWSSILTCNTKQGFIPSFVLRSR
jgi:hypothetical protein